MLRPQYQALHVAHFRHVATAWARLRPLIVTPTLVGILVLLAAAGVLGWRLVAVGSLLGGALVYQLVDVLRSRRAHVAERAVFHTHLVVFTALAGVVALTGGLASPLTPVLIPSAMGTVVAYGRSRETTITVAWSAAAIVGIALLPRRWLGPHIASPYDIALTLLSLVGTLVMLRTSIVLLADAYRRTGESLGQAREDVLVAAKRRTRDLETLGGRVAHELKNPLAAIKGLVQLLSRGMNGERVTARMGVVLREVERMEGILREYLSFSRPLDALRLEPLELGQLADDVVGLLEPRAFAAGVSVSRAPGAATILGDEGRLKEALLNLAANAVESTPAGGGVTIVVHEVPGGARLSVRDTGKGMSAEQLARLGTPYFTDREGGTGLGVVIARSAVMQHGGTLAYESELGAGTIARITLPRTPPQETTDEQAASR